MRDRDRQIGLAGPVVRRYERVCFDRDHLRVHGKPTAALIAPGHPLLDAVVDLVVERYSTLLKQGTVLVDGDDPGEQPRLMVAVTQQITDGNDPARTVSKRFEFVELRPDSTAETAGPAPYLDYRPPSRDEIEHVQPVLDQPWLAAGAEELAVNWAVEHGISEHFSEVRDRVEHSVARTRAQVRQRLTQEINYWDARHAELLDRAAAGQNLKIKPETAHRRARDLERRLEKRLAELDADEALRPLPPVVAGGALVVPYGLLQRLTGGRDEPVAAYARATAEVERRAVEAVMAAERRLGRPPVELPRNNKGFDICSFTPDGHYLFVEVKGRITGAEDFMVTRNEVLYGKNADRYRLALVSVSPDGPEHDEVRYLTDPFSGVTFDDFAVSSVRFDWHEMWSRGGDPR